jgi:hypothetical protein
MNTDGRNLEPALVMDSGFRRNDGSRSQSGQSKEKQLFTPRC